MILADMGADVIKIERPRTGDQARNRAPMIKSNDGREISSRFLGVNRNKKSVSIDLRNPRCKTAFEELVRKSDVLVDNWGSGALQRLGLGYDHLSEINPGLVCASITGYGDSEGMSGPYSNRPANNLAIQAMSAKISRRDGSSSARLRMPGSLEIAAGSSSRYLALALSPSSSCFSNMSANL